MIMNIVATEQRNKIHPHKFALWVGIGSIIMFFGGLTSASIIKSRDEVHWIAYNYPDAFWYSTGVIMASSMTLWLACRAFKNKRMGNYRLLLGLTTILGVLFLMLQTLGFITLWKQHITVNSEVSHSFMYVIFGAHALHVTGGIVALLILFFKSFSSKIKNYNYVPVEVTATYWHFVDILWVYLVLFLMLLK
jgi:cytochrome c oxidase subunit 3